MTTPKRYLVTSALPYANGLKHIGHLAGAYLPADIYVRYLRAQKRDVVWVCGSDEHGAAITIQAMKEGTTPQAIVDKYHEILKQNFADLGISFDIYHRTSAPLHHETAQEFFTALNNKGDLEVLESEQFYDEEAKTFLADRYIVGTCPVCANENAFGDQCEKCGSTLSPDELINPRSTLSGNPPIKKATKHWYLPLNKYEAFLQEWLLEGHKVDWKTNVYGQCKSWLDAGLQPRAVTRDLDWGIKVPVQASPNPSKGGELAPNNLEVSEEKHGSDTPPLEGGEADILPFQHYETADPVTYGLLKTFVKDNRSQPTEAEAVLWEQLRGKQLDGYKFRRQHIIGNYIADFVCLSQKLIIEVDGLYHQLPENKESDEQRSQWLNTQGFDVLRFSNEQVLNDIDNTIKKIKNVLQAFHNPSQGGELAPNNLETSEKSPGSQNPPLEGREAFVPGKVLYVWFDAPIGYISATKQWALNTGKDWAPYWNDPETKLVHFIGKDNIVFHCIIFPVMLKLHGNILPDNVPANEFMNLEGDKMSTSRGWSIEMEDYINDWVKPENGGGQMVDALRYYLNAIAPETKDSEFTWKGFYEAYKSQLSDVLGNFVNRAFVLMHKLTKGKVPPLHLDVLDEEDKTLLGKFATTKEKVETLIEQYKFRDALVEIIDLARSGNGYLQKKQPWKLADKASPNPSKGGALEQNNLEVAGEKHGFQNPPLDGREALEAQKLIDNCLHICLQLTANITILIHPFLPNTASKLCYMLKVVEKMLEWENAGKTKLLSVGYNLREPQILFRKIEQSEIDAQIEKLKVKSKKMQDASDKAQATTSLPNLSEGGALVPNNPEISEKNHGSQNPLLEGREAVKPEIVFDDFAKIDLKVGTIVAAEKVEKADKLLKLSVDLGFETRTIVSGIALHFKPEEIVGKQVTVVCNLAPRKMRGIESNGMILMAENADGKLHFINPEEKISAGAGVS